MIPLGFDPGLFRVGQQSLTDSEVVLGLFGRLVPEKGVRDAVSILERVNRVRPARLLLARSGPEASAAFALAADLGLDDRIEIYEWSSQDELAERYRRCHVVLVPSRATPTWAEQFGRVIVEAQASGAVVAGYATGAIPEVAGASAILAAEGSLGGLAGSVIELVGDSDEYARRRDKGIALSVTRTWDAVAQQQAALYRRAREGNVERARLPRSPRQRRALARDEFGETAPTPVGPRPFAPPLLRRGGVAPTFLALLIDAVTEARTRAKS